jgi:hypothetical protein
MKKGHNEEVNARKYIKTHGFLSIKNGRQYQRARITPSVSPWPLESSDP